MSESKLVGYVRKSNNGGAIRLSVDVESFNDATKYATKDGREYVSLIVNIEKVKEIISGEREVTSLCQIVDE